MSSWACRLLNREGVFTFKKMHKTEPDLTNVTYICILADQLIDTQVRSQRNLKLGTLRPAALRPLRFARELVSAVPYPVSKLRVVLLIVRTEND
ncbi:hypothetical protein EVAR_3505_1 [Eumeta japonica]|uniref:Uncharacterized protein n=1 Tax=Eumeta variegata TaxID=151549 RepID=A0A4C1YTC2_EUMVA|nr:hypothetical protein EVAR_3505_1 [Eumeta japonica]